MIDILIRFLGEETFNTLINTYPDNGIFMQRLVEGSVAVYVVMLIGITVAVVSMFRAFYKRA